jgi:uncharacterized alkaline shock family protein YloU
VSATASTALVEHSPDASTRGRTILADRVVQKIAARAALEVPGCLGFSRTIIGIDTRRSAVTATAVTDGSITGLTLSIAVAYPAPITTTTRAVRTHVQQRVETLCDLSVDHIDITVAALPRPHRKEARVQ